MKLSLPIIVGLLLLVSCSRSPQSKLRRAQRLIREAEASGLVWRSDTVFKSVVITVPMIEHDTLVQTVNFRDTITLVRDRLVTKVKVNAVTKEVYISSKCDSVVIVKRVPYTVERQIKVGDSRWTDFKQAVLWLLVGFAFCWGLRLFKVIP